MIVLQSHTVDQDDNETYRYADAGDVAEIVRSFQHGNGEPYYNVGFPASGATGFYDEPELASMFRPVAN